MQSDADPNKRPRLALQTPAGQMIQNTGLATPSSVLPPPTLDRLSAMPSGDGLLEYLRGRSGKVKELEDELSQTRSRCKRLQQELNDKTELVAILTAENKALKSATAKSSPPSGTTFTAVQHMQNQLDEELHKALLLEQGLAAAKQREAVSTQHIASLEALLAEQRVEQMKLIAEAEAAVMRLRSEVEAARAEAQVASRNADLATRAAQRRVETEQEVLRVARAQLEQLRDHAAVLKADLEQTRQRASRCEAEVAGLRGSAQHVRLQLLEEELRVARDALAAAQTATVTAAQQQQHLPPQQLAAFGRLQSPPPPQQQYSTEDRKAGCASGDDSHVRAGRGGGGASWDLEVQLPEAFRAHWPTLIKALGVASGLPLSAQAAEAGRVALALAAEEADLRVAVKTQDESLMQLRAAASGSDAYAKELQHQLADLRSRLERCLTAERVAERRAAAIEQERDALRNALSHPTSRGSVTGAGGAEAPVPGSLSGRMLAGQQAAALEQLQQLNEQLQKQVSLLQEEVAASASSAEAQALGARAATARAEAAEQCGKQLEREADALAREVASLQERLGRGELIRAGGVRVLHMRHNPDLEARQAAREEAIIRLSAENEALRGRVAELETELQQQQQTIESQQVSAGRPGNENSPTVLEAPRSLDRQLQGSPATAAISPPALGTGVAIAVKDAEITVLRRKVEEGDKAMNRLKLVFKDRIMVFREACYSLFGYRVDMTAEATAASDAAGAPTTITLKPQHADDPAALLVFRCTGGGHMELVPNTFTRERLAREVETFVRKFNCIPALTANLTMENFQKQTQC